MTKELKEKYDLIIEALAHFEKMYIGAKDAKSRKIHLRDLQATKREYAEFCKKNKLK